MTVVSSDGRPPSRGLRLLEWRWLALVVGVVAWILLGRWAKARLEKTGRRFPVFVNGNTVEVEA